MKKFKGKVLVTGILNLNSSQGGPACGKTALIQMYVSNGQNFLKDYNMTQGAEVSSKIITFDNVERDVELFFFDLGGNDVYDSITNELLNGADLVMYVFDCTNSESIFNCQSWFEKIQKANNGKKLPGVLVSTKNDLRTAKAVDIVEGKNMAQKLGVQYFEVSAARNMDVEHPFQYLAEKLV